MHLLVYPLFSQLGQGTDGNPHGWDRRRRCDAVAYDPPCGICEGYGGIPWGDRNEEISLTTCRPAETQTALPRRPVWADEMTIDPYWAVQIGPKVDPFCFAAVPSNSSAGPLCYQNQTGTQSYDFAESRSLLFDISLGTAFGAIHSRVTARGPYLWIVNYFPWYLLGLRQCICTNPTEGGRGGAPVFPLNPNWTGILSHVGTEVLGVEHIDEQRTLDHWAYGPHHVWTVPETGSIVRMWQPYNGLQVMPAGTLPGKAAPVASPPAECASKWAIKVGCDENGYPTADGEVLARAVERVPSAALRSSDFGEMAARLNAQLHRYNASPCDDWTTEEIHELQLLLADLRAPPLQDVYAAADDGRSSTVSARALSERRELVRGCEAWGDCHVLRDGHCHEAVMWVVHHLDAASQRVLAQSRQPIPMLPLAKHACEGSSCSPSYQLYEAQVSCMDCHAA